MLELALAVFIFIGIPLILVGYMAFVKSQEGTTDPLEDLKNWGSQDKDPRA